VVRRLVAILAADAVDSSRLMGQQEIQTFATLKRHLVERLGSAVSRYGGRQFKDTGDGALVEFPSAVDALSAAIEFQQRMVEANEDQAPETAILFRVGVHLGDVIVDGDDLRGDAVNVASRLEGSARHGGILISGDLRNHVAGKVKASFEELGPLALKSIERSVLGFAVNWSAGDWPVLESVESTPPAASEDRGARSSIEANIALREYIKEQIRRIPNRREWYSNRLNKFNEDVARRIYEMEELEGKGINPHWAFDVEQSAKELVDVMKKHGETRALSAVQSELLAVFSALARLIDALDDIHRPLSMDQHDEDHSFTDEEWEAIREAGRKAEETLATVANAAREASVELDKAFAKELNSFVERLKRVQAVLDEADLN
jgi:class 3 adenylate cyclase